MPSSRKIGGGHRPLAPNQLDRRGRSKPGAGRQFRAIHCRVEREGLFLSPCPWLLRAAAVPVMEATRQKIPFCAASLIRSEIVLVAPNGGSRVLIMKAGGFVL